jgi:pimeloyl-[acyl-carrier protein] synthase
MQELEIDVVDPRVLRDPYPQWARLREMDRVVRSRSLGPSVSGRRGPAAYVVHRFDDVRRVFADHDRYSSARLFGGAVADREGNGERADPGSSGSGRLMAALMSDPQARALLEDPDTQANLRAGILSGNTMLAADRPEHDRLRGVVSKAFLPSKVSVLEGNIRELTQDLIRPLAAGGEHELMATLADPLPSIVIAEMLGIPREDHARFKEWSNAVIGSRTGDGDGSGEAGGTGADAEDPLARIRSFFLDPRRMALISEFRRYLAEQIERYRVERADNLISRMVAANEDDVLSSDELMASTFLLLIAGNETTTRLIANLTLALDRHPDQRALLIEDPGLIPAAVEEGLRWDPPVQTMSRVSAVDTEIGGTAIPRGSLVTMIMAAANRDPLRFADPDRFDVRRADAANVSFGYGIHFCLGAPLARRETRIAFEELLKVAPGLRVLTPDDELLYRPLLGPALRGPERVLVGA